MIQLVKFACGCIGTKPVNKKTCIVSRDSEEGLFIEEAVEHSPTQSSWWEKEGYNNEGYKDLTEEEARPILDELRKLVVDGYKYRQIRGALQ